jgi:hypothetical protein
MRIDKNTDFSGNEIKIKKGDKYFVIYEIYIPHRKRLGFFMDTEGGEGMELNEEKFYDHINKFFDENM